ncbi:MAG: hypothetical protein MUD14_21620 [Hydrococcus sp. Prado102]|jgi:hypothetical protein|nr:hypothetical protein [Hydrococcus sp. Prado102]
MQLVSGVILGVLAIAVAYQWQELQEELKKADLRYQKAVHLSKNSNL